MLTSDLLLSCSLCPRRCKVDRFAETGFCNTHAETLVSSVFLHKGEEPVLSGERGICNVFFAHCNLQCLYCQNYQISCNTAGNAGWMKTEDEAVSSIIPYLNEGIRMLGFVSPTHQVIQMVGIINSLHKKGYNPTVVYNTNAYENLETLRELEGIVDVYLPDFKYINNMLGLMYSGVKNYFEVASLAIREMYRQKGTSLLMGDDGLVESGLIVRHLVLPNHADESIELLRYLEDTFSSRLHVSLMSQYYPPSGLNLDEKLNRTITVAEYQKVLDALEEIGFRGWAQSPESSASYRPDFMSENPFVE